VIGSDRTSQSGLVELVLRTSSFKEAVA
jgi:hypothetical protein